MLLRGDRVLSGKGSAHTRGGRSAMSFRTEWSKLDSSHGACCGEELFAFEFARSRVSCVKHFVFKTDSLTARRVDGVEHCGNPQSGPAQFMSPPRRATRTCECLQCRHKCS